MSLNLNRPVNYSKYEKPKQIVLSQIYVKAKRVGKDLKVCLGHLKMNDLINV